MCRGGMEANRVGGVDLKIRRSSQSCAGDRHRAGDRYALRARPIFDGSIGRSEVLVGKAGVPAGVGEVIAESRVPGEVAFGPARRRKVVLWNGPRRRLRNAAGPGRFMGRPRWVVGRRGRRCLERGAFRLDLPAAGGGPESGSRNGTWRYLLVTRVEVEQGGNGRFGRGQGGRAVHWGGLDRVVGGRMRFLAHAGGWVDRPGQSAL